jgi:hypothetical protein
LICVPDDSDTNDGAPRLRSQVAGEVVEGRFGNHPALRSPIRSALTVDHYGKVEVTARRGAAAPGNRGGEATIGRHHALVRMGRESFDSPAGGSIGAHPVEGRPAYAERSCDCASRRPTRVHPLRAEARSQHRRPDDSRRSAQAWRSNLDPVTTARFCRLLPSRFEHAQDDQQIRPFPNMFPSGWK